MLTSPTMGLTDHFRLPQNVLAGRKTYQTLLHCAAVASQQKQFGNSRSRLPSRATSMASNVSCIDGNGNDNDLSQRLQSINQKYGPRKQGKGLGVQKHDETAKLPCRITL